MQSYDLCFSLGIFCATSQALRKAGLQFCSCPLDWVSSPGIVASAEMVASGFAHWLDKEDLRLMEVRHGPGFFTRIFLNRRTGFGFGHEFSDFERFEPSYAKVKAMYDRRIVRMLERLEASSRMLGVFTELPVRPCASEDELRRAQRILKERYPGSSVDILYFYEDPACVEPRVVSSADGITVVAADYREFDHGVVTHFVRFDVLAGFLRGFASSRDYRSEEERRRFADEMRRMSESRWGVGRVRRRINRQAYRLYRYLERVLVNRGVFYREGPMWYLWPGLVLPDERKEGAR